ncbi:ATP-binding protein [Bifidobacterium eulemuris]|uniref:ATP-binding protein n=1 Tax=Bifidobacterium eulemuris TaxID=1765219 RepID=A0A261G049_9BIFI|nr:AAA family ATPase [Bifidobacterium eulemuris]OZG64791.1 ATPase [Bifidobacterium eulemuris]QOL32532.1 ATP-binding protein [Bifidobacterium eulemuris]
MRRKAYDDLLAWKNGKTKQALLVTGARQIGKTYLIREFGGGEYDHVAEFNLATDDVTRESFLAARSADDLALRISIAADGPLVPGHTLVFIDEVQECPNVVTYIKTLVDRGEYDYVLSGSLLGVELENVRSYPVGYMSELMMFPMDFEEFCWATGLADQAFAMARDCFERQTPVPDFLHERLSALFHRYLLTGGMPDVVAAFVRDNAVDNVRTLQADIRRFYNRDITQYAPRDRRLVIQEIYRMIPGQLNNPTRRFKVGDIADVQRFSQVQDEFLWLSRANVALPVYNVDEPKGPLRAAEERRLLKLFYSDVGLLTGTYEKRSTLGILDGLGTQSGETSSSHDRMNFGGVYENVVAQELVAHGFAPYYFTGKKVGELDFLIEDADGRIRALEIKSGSRFRSHAALDKALVAPGYGIDEAIVFAETNVERDGKVLYLPVYMVSLLHRTRQLV